MYHGISIQSVSLIKSTDGDLDLVPWGLDSGCPLLLRGGGGVSCREQMSLYIMCVTEKPVLKCGFFRFIPN